MLEESIISGSGYEGSAGMKLAQIDNCNMKNKLDLHAMESGNGLISDGVNYAKTLAISNHNSFYYS